MKHEIQNIFKNLFTLTRHVPKRVALLSAIAFGVIVPTAGAFAWGPSRTTYTTAHPADHVVFNSITDNPSQGDERNFMQIREASASNDTYADSISLKPDTEYVVFIYYHNDAASNLNASGKGVATGAYVKAELPTYVNDGQSNVNAEGFVGATNAKPKEVFDEVTFNNKSGSDLTLSYEKGSAAIHNKGKTDGDTLSDTIVTSGAKIGYDKLDGIVPGCNDYAGYVTLRVKTGKATNKTPTTTSYTVQKDVREKGSTAWNQQISAKAGDTVQYMITYKNTGTAVQNDVVVKDSLPAGVTYVAGSSKLKNSNYPNGKSVSDNVVSSTGINVGNYSKGGTAYVLFDAKIADDDALGCGTNTLTNSASVGNQSDTAVVTVKKTCTTPTQPVTPVTPTPPTQPTAPVTPIQPVSEVTPTPTPLPSTGPAEVVGGALGTGSLGLGMHHYLASRRALRKAVSLK